MNSEIKIYLIIAIILPAILLGSGQVTQIQVFPDKRVSYEIWKKSVMEEHVFLNKYILMIEKYLKEFGSQKIPIDRFVKIRVASQRVNSIYKNQNQILPPKTYEELSKKWSKIISTTYSIALEFMPSDREDESFNAYFKDPKKTSFQIKTFKEQSNKLNLSEKI